jgi:uncharacterized protein (TIGR02266 family)
MSAAVARHRSPPPLQRAALEAAERRRAIRVVIAVEVTFLSRENFFRGRAKNLSEGGLFLETRARRAPGEVILVDLRLMKHALALECEVVWVESDERDETTGIGVRFVGLTPHEQTVVEAFMMLRDPLRAELTGD